MPRILTTDADELGRDRGQARVQQQSLLQLLFGVRRIRSADMQDTPASTQVEDHGVAKRRKARLPVAEQHGRRW